jgi:phosphate transport system protein
MVLSEGREMSADAYPVKMLTANEIPGFLPCHVQEMDGQSLFYYEVTSRQSLQSAMENRTVSAAQLELLLHSIAGALEQAAGYLLPADGLMLRPDYVFLNPEQTELWFCYYPGCEETIREQLAALGEFVITRLENEERRAVFLGYAFYQTALKADVTPDTFRRLLREGKEEPVKELREKAEQPDESKEDLPDIERDFFGDSPVCREEKREWTKKTQGREKKAADGRGMWREIVQEKVAVMRDRACAEVQMAMEALLAGDVDLARKVMQADDDIDAMIVDIEDSCILLIAKQQPIAHDLRVIATGFKISTDIERIGDHAYDIAKTVQQVEVPLDSERMKCVQVLGDCAVDMVAKAMRAYRQHDVQLADDVRRLDKKIDAVFERTFYALSEFVTTEAARQKRITQLLFIARFLERIGDHAVNIAEWVIYRETAVRIQQKKKA